MGRSWEGGDKDGFLLESRSRKHRAEKQNRLPSLGAPSFRPTAVSSEAPSPVGPAFPLRCSKPGGCQLQCFSLIYPCVPAISAPGPQDACGLHWALVPLPDPLPSTRSYGPSTPKHLLNPGTGCAGGKRGSLRGWLWTSQGCAPAGKETNEGE